MATAEVAVVATRTLARGLPAAVGLDWTTRRGLLGLGLLNPSPSSLPSSPSRIHTWTAWGRATLHAPPVAPRAQGTTSGTFGEPQSSSQTRSLMGKVVQDATARASAAVGSACKAAAEATERMKEARERLARSHRAAYLWLPRPVRQVVESQSHERQQVIALHFDAFWQNHGRMAGIAAGGASTLLLWKLMLGVTSVLGGDAAFTTQSVLLGASGIITAGGFRMAKQRNTIDPDQVYAEAMRRLNSNLGVLEAMGAPLVGTEMRAYILSGGGLRLQGMVPMPRSHRLHMVFLLRGTEARGIVSIEAKRWKGSTELKLLALDIPSADGNSVRIFLAGKPSQLEQGPGLFDELCKPLRTASTMKLAQDADDDEQAAREAAHLAIRRDALRPKPLLQGGGLYPWERLVERYHDLRKNLSPRLARH